MKLSALMVQLQEFVSTEHDPEVAFAVAEEGTVYGIDEVQTGIEGEYDSRTIWLSGWKRG